ncbi:hypothetical protein HY637_03800 [Candidatus Woesearchaeota archaeon]|nr:hypothetical protein [Candidatus Woesearchaeota archaeon]
MKKRGIFFTIDALLASGIIILSIILISNFYVYEQQKVNVNYAAQDMVRVFSSLTVGEVNNEYVKNLTLSGIISNTNNTLIEQIGEFWAEDNTELAKNFTKNLTESIIPDNYGFSVLVNGEEIYLRNLPVDRALVSSRRIISGIAKAKPTQGFTTRVLLTGIKSKKTSAYAYFGGYEGDGNLTKKLVLPNDVISFNGSYLEVDAGGNFNLYINGIFSGSYAKGSAGGGNMLADKWNLSNLYLANFKPGENNITINFTSGESYIAGGFLRVTYITSSYNDTSSPGFEKYWLPGVEGAINIYSSIYAPNEPDSMNMSLHFLSQYQVFLVLGNTTIFESTVSSSEQNVVINNSNISNVIEYASLSQKTIPLRIGLKSSNVTISGKISDSALITDRTSSMSACDIGVNCTTGLCDSNAAGGCHDRRDNVAIQADKKFIDTVLQTSGSKVALVGFGTDAAPVCDFHDFSDDNASLKYGVSNYSNEWCGYTCISCGIQGATELLTENEVLYGLSQKTAINTTQFQVGDSVVSASIRFNISANSSKFVKSRLTLLGRDVATEDGYYDCIYFNGNYIGRMCEPHGDPGWHTCSYALKPEWFVGNASNVTITGGTTEGCFQTSGNNDDWDFKDVKLAVWESETSLPNLAYNDTNKSEIQIGDSPLQEKSSLLLALNISKSKIKSANLEFEVLNVNPLYYDCVYINGNYVGSVDYQEWNITNVWQKIYFDVPVAWLKDGQNEVNFTAGTTSGCHRTTGTNDDWNFRNVNLSTRWSDELNSYSRNKAMLVMSDGEANTKIGDCAGCDSTGARNETVQKACEAKSLYGISVYTILFGDITNSNARKTLNQSACCDDCSQFYIANNSDDLIEVYTKIAQSVGNITYQAQSINLSGGNLAKTVLYPDSYLSFNYSAPESHFNKVPLRFETDRFGNNLSQGTLTVYPNTSVYDAKATSYSGNKWTDNLVVNGNNVYRLGDYGNNYQDFGDPFDVNIPANGISIGSNTILISTGLNSSSSSGGSNDSRIIYTLLLNGFADYSTVVAKSDGCSWTISFEDGSASTIKIPSDYNGADICSFASQTYDSNDALDNAVFQLFSNLDIDKDGKLEVNIDENSLNINTLTVSKVPSLWGPAIVEIRVWE